MVKTETRISIIFETETTQDQSLDVKTESLADLWPHGVAVVRYFNYDTRRAQVGVIML